MPRRGWTRTGVIAAALGLVVTGAVAYGMWFHWEWKVMVGWQALVSYIRPRGATGRKETLQVYAVIVAGGIATITAAVGLVNLGLTRRSLKQQRELEAQRAQSTALQAYYEQIGKLLSEKALRTTKRKEIRELARGQTLTVLQELDAIRKRGVLVFLHGAGLVGADNPAVELTGADLGYVDLKYATWLEGVDLKDANLQGASLPEAKMQGAWLQRANLKGATLNGVNLQHANLQRAKLGDTQLSRVKLKGSYLKGAKVNANQLAEAESLEGATMPDGSKHP